VVPRSRSSGGGPRPGPPPPARPMVRCPGRCLRSARLAAPSACSAAAPPACAAAALAHRGQREQPHAAAAAVRRCPPRAAPPRLPRRRCCRGAQRRPHPARPAARSADAGPSQAACLGCRQTPRSGRGDKRTWSARGQAQSAARCDSRQVHRRESHGAGLRSCPPGQELIWAGDPGGTHPPRKEHGGGDVAGSDTRRLGARPGRAAGCESLNPQSGNDHASGAHRDTRVSVPTRCSGKGRFPGRSPGLHEVGRMLA
jgi:hypothetical protein